MHLIESLLIPVIISAWNVMLILTPIPDFLIANGFHDAHFFFLAHFCSIFHHFFGSSYVFVCRSLKFEKIYEYDTKTANELIFICNINQYYYHDVFCLIQIHQFSIFLHFFHFLDLHDDARRFDDHCYSKKSLADLIVRIWLRTQIQTYLGLLLVLIFTKIL